MVRGNARACLKAIGERFREVRGVEKVPPLPYLLLFAGDVLVEDARAFSTEYQGQLKSIQKRSGKAQIRSGLVEEALFFHGMAGRPRLVLEVADIVGSLGAERLVTPAMYLLTLQAIRTSKDRSLVRKALALYVEMHEQKVFSTARDRNMAAVLLLEVFGNCRDFAELLKLKMVYEKYMTRLGLERGLEARYIGAFVSVYLNSGQYTRGIDLFEEAVERLRESLAIGEVFALLPTKKVLLAMSLHQDVDLLAKWLEKVLDSDPSFFGYDVWTEFLGLGLQLNHYGLVKLIYSRLIMKGLENVSLDELMFTKMDEQNEVLSSLSERTLTEILRTLASNGDVNSTLALIEWHYLHKSFKGEKGLTKELCLDIIVSYCYHDEDVPSGKDASIENTLRVINNFTGKLSAEFDLSYRDLCEAMSYRFMRYNAVDANTEAAERRKTNYLENKLLEEDETGVKPQKVLNGNLHTSKKGNILMNAEILDFFVRDTLQHILLENYNKPTLTIFINCLLHHIMKYQNATGTVVALQAMHHINPHVVSEWLNQDLYDIILRTVSRSPAAKYLGYKLYQHITNSGLTITSAHYGDLISSAMKGEEDNELVQYYVSQASEHNVPLSEQTKELMKKKQVTIRTSSILEPEIYTETEKANRNKYYEMDIRDSGYLNNILTKTT